MLVDTQAHLTWESYENDLDQVLDRAVKAGVGIILDVGVDLETSQKALEQSRQLSQDSLKIFPTIGLHPHEAMKYADDKSREDVIHKINQLLQANQGKVVAVGETGLDYFFQDNPGFNPSPLSPGKIKASQLRLYKDQIALAHEFNLPLIIHCRPSASSGLRDAWKEIFIEELQGLTGVFHSFTSTKGDASRALTLGFYLSFSGMITYPQNEQLREVVKQTPLDKILTETDSPFLPPQQIRGKRNEPAYVRDVVQVIAEIKGASFNQITSATSNNAYRLLGIKTS